MIAGLDDKDNEPFICGMDTIGAIETAKDFMVAGTAPDSLYGMCESMWQPDMVGHQHCKLLFPSHRCLWGLMTLGMTRCSAVCMTLRQVHMVLKLPEGACMSGAYWHASCRVADVNGRSCEG